MLKENRRRHLDNIATFGQLPVTQDKAQGSNREEEDVQIFHPNTFTILGCFNRLISG